MSDIAGSRQLSGKSTSATSVNGDRSGASKEDLRCAMLAAKAHSIRTPLALIGGTSQHLLAGGVPSELDEDLRLIRDQADLLHQNLEQILTLASCTSTGSDNFADLADALRNSLARHRAALDEKDLRVAVAGAKVAAVHADPHLLDRMIDSLIRHMCELSATGVPMLIAVKADENGRTAVEVESLRSDDEGLADAERPMEGEIRFAAELAALFGGELLFDQTAGGPTVAVLELRSAKGMHPSAGVPDPAGKRRTQNRKSQRSEHPEATPASEPPLVLVIEDDDELRAFIERTLTPEYRVAGAGDGDAGLSAARQLLPDLILCDLVLPDRSGERIVTEISTDPDLATTPVIVVTGRTEGALPTRLLQGGADDYVSKPFVATELKARISNLIKNRLSEQDLRQQLEDAQTLTSQLQYALDARVVIEQAKGIMAGERGISPAEAFEVLRREARSTNHKLRDVATAVVHRGLRSKTR